MKHEIHILHSLDYGGPYSNLEGGNMTFTFRYDEIEYLFSRSSHQPYCKGWLYNPNLHPVSKALFDYLWYKKTGRIPYQGVTKEQRYSIWKNLEVGSTKRYIEFLDQFERPAEKERFIKNRMIPLIEWFLDYDPGRSDQPGDIFDEFSELLERLKPSEKIKGFTSDFAKKVEGFRFPNPERLEEAYTFLIDNKIIEGDMIDFIAIHQGLYANKRIKYLLKNGDSPHIQSFIAYLLIMFGKKRDAHVRDAERLFFDAWDRPLDFEYRSTPSESIVLKDSDTDEALVKIMKPQPN